MTRAAPLPSSLAGRPFAITEAAVLGVSRSRLRARDLVAPTRGARMPRHDEVIPDAETASERQDRLRRELLTRAAAFMPVLTPQQFLSHDTGLAAVGAPLPYAHCPLDLHISARRPAAKPRRKGAVGHLLPAREPATGIVGGLRIEHPVRLWHQVGETWALDDLIAAADFLVLPKNNLVTLEQLRAAVERSGDSRGGIRSRALAEVRLGAESAKETALRLAMTRAGLPEPILQHDLYDDSGKWVARLDTYYPEYKVAPEYDGRGHAEADQFRRDADRWDAIRACGVEHVRILSHHLWPDPQLAVDKVAASLFRAGWRPGRN